MGGGPATSLWRSAGAVALGLGLVLAGGAFDVAAFHVPGVALLALGVVAAAWVWLAASTARVERRTGPRLIEEGVPFPVRVTFRAGAPPPGGELRDPLLGEPVRLAFARELALAAEARFERRGRRRIPAGTAVVADPLGLAVRRLAIGEPAEVIVLPRVSRVVALDGGGRGERFGELGVPLRSAASEIEPEGVRAHIPGSPASRIHWPSVARAGELLERNLIGADETRPIVVCDARAPAGEEALDMAVRATASLVVRLAREGGCALLLPGDRRPVEIGPDLRAWPAEHIRLALLGPAEEPPASARLQQAGTVFWVRAAAGPGVPAGLARVGASVRWLIGPPADPAPGSARFSVAGCVGYRLAGSRLRGAA